jgi:hypothetical protein
MLKKLAIVVIAASALAGCATSNAQTAMLSDAVLDTSPDCAPARVAGESAYVVEGFGGKGDNQLMVTELRPMSRCTQGGPTARATLSPQK